MSEEEILVKYKVSKKLVCNFNFFYLNVIPLIKIKEIIQQLFEEIILVFSYLFGIKIKLCSQQTDWCTM